MASIVYFFLSCCCLSLLHACHHHHPGDLRNKVTGGVIAGAALGGGRIMPMLRSVFGRAATRQLAASLCPVNDQAATLTGELPIHNIQPPPSRHPIASSQGLEIRTQGSALSPLFGVSGGQIQRSRVGQAGSVWPGLPPPANHPLVAGWPGAVP